MQYYEIQVSKNLTMEESRHRFEEKMIPTFTQIEWQSFRPISRLPYNEFSEQFTGDMPSMDYSLHFMWNPSKCDFPEDAKREQQFWLKLRRKNEEIGRME